MYAFQAKQLLSVRNEKTEKFKRIRNCKYYYNEKLTIATVSNLNFLFSNDVRFDNHAVDIIFNLFYYFLNKNTKIHPEAIIKVKFIA